MSQWNRYKAGQIECNLKTRKTRCADTSNRTAPVRWWYRARHIMQDMFSDMSEIRLISAREASVVRLTARKEERYA